MIDLDKLTLASGGHDNPEDGACLLEAVALFSGEPFSDAPACVSPILGMYGRNLNDILPDDKRQQLKPYIPRLPGTAGDGRDAAGMREHLRKVAREGWLIDLTPEGLRPELKTRIFRDVKTPLCLGVFTTHLRAGMEAAA